MCRIKILDPILRCTDIQTARISIEKPWDIWELTSPYADFQYDYCYHWFGDRLDEAAASITVLLPSVSPRDAIEPRPYPFIATRYGRKGPSSYIAYPPVHAAQTKEKLDRLLLEFGFDICQGAGPSVGKSRLWMSLDRYKQLLLYLYFGGPLAFIGLCHQLHRFRKLADEGIDSPVPHLAAELGFRNTPVKENKLAVVIASGMLCERVLQNGLQSLFVPLDLFPGDSHREDRWVHYVYYQIESRTRNAVWIAREELRRCCDSINWMETDSK